MRTIVEPALIAASRSALIPMQRCSSSWRSANRATSPKARSISGGESCGPMAMQPATSSPSRRAAATSDEASSGGQPPCAALPLTSSCTKMAAPGSWRAISDTNRDRSTLCHTSTSQSSQLPDLVRLQPPNEVDLHSRLGRGGHLVPLAVQFLGVVLTDHRQTGMSRSFDCRAVEALGHCHDADVSNIAAGIGYPLLDALGAAADLLGVNHRSAPLPAQSPGLPAPPSGPVRHGLDASNSAHPKRCNGRSRCR